MCANSLFRLFVSLFVLSLSPSLLAQGEATMLFLRIPPSPLLNGMGGVGTALPINEPFAFHYNPAQLGYNSQTTILAYQFYPSKMQWLHAINIPDLTFNSSVFIAGYNFQNLKSGLPFSIGFGYMKGKIDYGENIITDISGNEIGRFNSYENYNSYAIGLGVNYYVNLNVGMAFKNIESKLSPGVFVNGERFEGKAKATARDIGVQLIIPALKLFNSKLAINTSSGYPLVPYFNVSFGYARTNIGDEVKYGDLLQSDPIPRTAQVGYALSVGLDLNYKKSILRVLGIDWSSDALDILIERDGINFTYKKGWGDINFWENVILAKSSDDVENRHGFRFQFFEFFQLVFGNFNGPGWGEGVNTVGFAVQSRGLLKLSSFLFDDKYVKFIGEHFDLQYSWTHYNPKDMDTPLRGTIYRSLTFSITGF